AGLRQRDAVPPRVHGAAAPQDRARSRAPRAARHRDRRRLSPARPRRLMVRTRRSFPTGLAALLIATAACRRAPRTQAYDLVREAAAARFVAPSGAFIELTPTFEIHFTPGAIADR